MKTKFISISTSIIVFIALFINLHIVDIEVGQNVMAQSSPPPGVCEGYKSDEENIGYWLWPIWIDCCKWTGKAMDGCSPADADKRCDVSRCELILE